jgi:thioredoxin reductase
MHLTKLPVAVIGAGPIGLAAAAHLVKRGETPIVFEAGPEVGHSVKSWAHVQIFSPWNFNIDPASRELLEQNNWTAPDPNHLPTGRELVEDYLEPLAQTPELKEHIHLNSKVTAVSRRRIDKMKNLGREDAPFVLRVESENNTQLIYARAVIDASGTWHNQNPISSDGLYTQGELKLSDKIFHGIPDVLGTAREKYANKRIAIVGGGHSAINAILELTILQETESKTEIVWILRKAKVSDSFGGQENDALPGRGQLGVRIRKLVEQGVMKVVNPFYILDVAEEDGGLCLLGETPEGEMGIPVDEIIAATGSRPDLEMLRELRISIDPSVESPTALAPLIDPNYHSCGSVPPHGEAELRQPESGFYIVGMKSYGRAPTFLMLTGYEQVRSVVAGLVGDWDAAKKVELKLPETGVCSGPVAVGASLIKVGTRSSQSEPIQNSCCG